MRGHAGLLVPRAAVILACLVPFLFVLVMTILQDSEHRSVQLL